MLSFSQGVAIKNTNVAPNSYAILDIDDSGNNKGILIPRVTTGQRTAIAGLGGTEEGLTVYDETTKSYWLWDGTAWVDFAAGGGSGWGLTGNAGTTNGTNFIGTTDNVALDIRTNNIIKTRFTTGGQIEVLNTGKSVFLGEGAGIVDDLTDNNNVFIGYEAGNSNTTGFRNTANGYLALSSNVSGNANTGTGWWALRDNTAGFNTAYGYIALAQNTSGSDNTAMGAGSLSGNLTGNYNTAFGYEALTSNTVSNNVAVGYQCLRTNTDGEHNTATGYQALFTNDDGDDNTAIGYQALTANDGGIRNTANGYLALSSNVSGNANTGTGWWALRDNTAGFNTAYGYIALAQNTSGSDNTAMGAGSLSGNLTGNYNTAFGYEALTSNTVSNNVAVGYQCLRSNTSGSDNTSVGKSAGFTITTGSQNTFLGTNADATGAAGTNRMALGYNASVNTNNKIRIGNASVTVIEGQVAWSFPSDKRFKKNIEEKVVGTDFIMKLRPVTFNIDVDISNQIMGIDDKSNYKGKYDIEKISQSGFIAQEIEQAAIETGYDFSGVNVPKDKNGYYNVSYSMFVVPLVKATQEQQEIIKQLQNSIKKLQAEVVQLKNN